jgi:putative SOS response-associated peptidase YedK
MCARYTLSSPQNLIAEVFGLDLLLDILPRYNVAPTQDVLAMRLDSAGERQFTFLRWGLIPSWAGDPKIGNRLVNARAETIAEKPAFRGAFRSRKRCLIVADGFFEWKTVGKKKQPFLFRQPNAKPFVAVYCMRSDLRRERVDDETAVAGDQQVSWEPIDGRDGGRPAESGCSGHQFAVTFFEAQGSTA